MASIQSNLAKYFIRQLRARSLHYLDNLDVLRVEQDKALMRIRPPKNINFFETNLSGVNGEWAYPSPKNNRFPNYVILYFHGGGYAVGSARANRGLVGKLVAEIGIKALSIDYRLAPEHPFPAGLMDAVSAYTFLLDQQKFQAEEIILMGDSAGAGLAMSTLLKLKELGLPQPLCAVALSPWSDLSLSGDSVQTHQDKDPILLTKFAKQWAKWYYTSHDPQNPLISPVFGDYSDVAPIYIQVGTDEILLSDSLRMIEVAKKYERPIIVDIWDSMMHVWQFGWQYIPESRQAILQIKDYITEMIDIRQAKQYPFNNPLNGGYQAASDDFTPKNDFESWIRYGSDYLKNLFDSYK